MPANKQGAWDPIETQEHAVRVSRHGMWAAVLVAGATGVTAWLSLMRGAPVAGVDPSAFVDAILFAGIALGIRRRSRFAAICGPVLFFVERAYAWSQSGLDAGGLGIFILVMLAFVEGVRGTFAFHRLAKATPAGTRTPPRPARA
jgi:hypothetical protein